MRLRPGDERVGDPKGGSGRLTHHENRVQAEPRQPVTSTVVSFRGGGNVEGPALRVEPRQLGSKCPCPCGVKQLSLMKLEASDGALDAHDSHADGQGQGSPREARSGEDRLSPKSHP
jgi:hypothetical protein